MSEERLASQTEELVAAIDRLVDALQEHDRTMRSHLDALPRFVGSGAGAELRSDLSAPESTP